MGLQFGMVARRGEGKGAVTSDTANQAVSANQQKKRDLLMFLFLTVVLAPALSVAVVGAYGFAIWMYQLIVGPPGT